MRSGDVSLISTVERVNLGALVFAATFIVTAFFGTVLGDPDTWWHLGSGRFIASIMRVPSTDPFSFSMPGAPWHAHEWGAELLMWGAYKAGGLSGLVALCAAAAGAASAILAGFLVRHVSPRNASIATALALFCLLPSALARPHLLALPLFVYWVASLLRAADEGRVPSLWLALVMVAWANIHGSFLLGIGMMGAIAIDATWHSEVRRGAVVGWGLFALAAIAASLVTPFGVAGYTYPLYVSSMTLLSDIGEWAGSTIRNSPVFFAVLMTGLSVLLVTGARFRPVQAGLFVGLLFLALRHRRHQFVFAFIGTLLAAGPLEGALARREKAAQRSRADAVMLAALLVLAVGAVIVRLAIPADATKGSSLPLAAIARLPADLRQRPVFNHYDYGGPLIFYGIRPFIDGRADMYGDAFFARYNAAEGGDRAAWDQLAHRYGIAWTILPRTSPLNAVVEQEQWRVLYRDAKVAIHVRDLRPRLTRTGERQTVNR